MYNINYYTVYNNIQYTVYIINSLLLITVYNIIINSEFNVNFSYTLLKFIRVFS
jgi:hypothetical protein